MINDTKKRYNKMYYAKNKERLLGLKKLERKEHPGINKEYCKMAYIKNREKRIAEAKKTRTTARALALEKYGGRCMCCGENRKEFLAIDHIGGGGKRHRKQHGYKNLALWLMKKGWPTGYRVLCHNCNMSMGLYGYCPHGGLEK
jgi:hypothetical protein